MSWKLKDGGKETEDEQEIADTFNKFFVDKLANLKKNIDPEMKKDPLEKLRKKMQGRNLKFSLKPVTEKTVKKAMHAMKKKKSAGRDGISQECLLIGKDIIKIFLQELSTAQSIQGCSQVNGKRLEHRKNMLSMSVVGVTDPLLWTEGQEVYVTRTL